MPYDFHSDATAYIQFLRKNAEKSIIPFLKKHLKHQSWAGLKVLELGCGEGGNLVPFAEQGCICIGIDLNVAKIEAGKQIMAKYIANGSLKLFGEDIFNPNIELEFKNNFDIIILKDVIEHIPNKDKALLQMRSFLSENGVLFVGWPPWAMPFGGHQQICENRLLRVLPWIHLLPKRTYKFLLEKFGEPKHIISELLEIKDFRVPIETMNLLVKQTNLHLKADKYYFINPIYEFKFGLKTRILWPFLSKIPYLRDWFTTSAYYLLSKN